MFREAVLITRQLGIQYLWIDSLCIIQGCKADWEQQSRQMGQVYSSAIINIANNSPIPGESIESVQARLAEEQSKLNDELDTLEFHTGHLEARGWVLQERVLAPATLYYGGEEIRWICRTAEFSASRPTESFEHRGIVLSKMFSHRTCDGNYGLRYISRVLADQDTDRLRDMEWEIMWKWLELVNIYSKRILTDENDRLTALSGCASLFERALGKPYLAGLWLSSIELRLLWEAVQPVKRPSQYLAPSWSWASLLSPVTNYQKRDINEESSHFLVEILGHNVSVSSNNPYGADSSEPRSWLRLHGKVFEGRLRFKREEWGEFVYFDVQDHPDDHKVAPDYPLPSMADFGTVWLLPVAWMGSWYASLVLVELGLTESRVFRRIGFCDCHSIEKAMWDSVIKESFLLV